MEHETRRLLLTVLLIGGTAAGCTESDPVNREIGTTLIYFTAPGLQTQGFTEIDTRVQAAEWDIQEAMLDLDGQQLDLRFGEACIYNDSVNIFPVPDGKCGGGIVLGSRLEPEPIKLSLKFTMQVKRARPPDSLLHGQGDFDGDGIRNDADNCVVEFNDNQQDNDGNGIGDTCSLIDPFSGNVSLDSDVDGVPDSFDNCLWLPNPFQADTSASFPDGVGDACEEQTAEVQDQINMSPVIELTLEADLIQPLLSTIFLTVDFNDALICDDFDSGTCKLDTSMDAIELCVQNSVTSAAFGCF